jgi:hypothetical protein
MQLVKQSIASQSNRLLRIANLQRWLAHSSCLHKQLRATTKQLLSSSRPQVLNLSSSLSQIITDIVHPVSDIQLRFIDNKVKDGTSKY